MEERQNTVPEVILPGAKGAEVHPPQVCTVIVVLAEFVQPPLLYVYVIV